MLINEPTFQYDSRKGLILLYLPINKMSGKWTTFIVTICLILATCFGLTAAGLERLYKRNNVLDNLTCVVGHEAFEDSSTFSAVQCVARCSNHGSCVSAFYDEGQTTCYGCRNVYLDTSGLKQMNGTKCYSLVGRYSQFF